MSGKRLRLAPANLPAIRDALADEIRELARSEAVGAEPYIRVALRHSWGTGDILAVSPCWWVSADMEELAVAASDDVPSDVLPDTMTGFLVFARPLPERITQGLPNSVSAVQWMAEESRRGEESGLIISLQFFTTDRTPNGTWSTPLSLVRFWGDSPESLYRVMRAVWALSSQERLCETKPVSAPWPASKDGPKPDPMARTVKMLVLREPPRTHGSGSGEGGAGRYSHRFVVRGFWRNQPCGPGHSERRLTWIPPFVKGPEGTPLVERETVRVWKR